MILDAAGLYAFFVQGSARHWAVTGEVELTRSYEELIVSPFAIVELESMVRERVGPEGWLAAFDQLSTGAWNIVHADAAHLRAMGEHIARGATLAEASVAALGS